MSSLHVRDPSGRQSVFRLSGDIVVFGRSRDCMLVLDAKGVSRIHGRFVREPEGRWWVEDLGAKNGILLNGRFISRHPLADGDVLTVGELALTYRHSAAGVPGSPTPALTLTDAVTAPGTTVERAPGVVSSMDARRLTALYEISTRLMDRRDVGDLVDVAASALIAELEAEVVVFGLTRDPERERDRVIIRPAGFAAGSITLSRSVLSRTLEARRAILVSDTSSDVDLRIAQSIVVGGIRSALCVPLMRQQDVTGFIYVDSRRCGRAYDDRDLQFASAVGAMAGTAIENARLAAAELVKQRMEAELARAREVQQAIMPSQWPAVEGWEVSGRHISCREVGGDYCDAIVTRDGRLWLLIADVCGKGAGAALLASSIHAAVHALIEQCPTPSRLLAPLNDLLVRHAVGASFVTLLAAVVDPATGEALVSSAGHPPPIHFSAERAPAPIPIEGGLMLGVVERTDYADTRWSIPQDSGTLLLYTDGVTEALDPAGEPFGEDRLLATLAAPASAGDVIATVLGELERFRGAAEQSDDLTLLACRRTSPT